MIVRPLIVTAILIGAIFYGVIVLRSVRLTFRRRKRTGDQRRLLFALNTLSAEETREWKTIKRQWAQIVLGMVIAIGLVLRT